MNKKITVFVFRDFSYKMNRITFSRTSIRLAGLAMAIFLIFSGTLAFRYFTVIRMFSGSQSLRFSMMNQLKEIESLKQQIRIFENDIEMLKSRLCDLKRFENKIRMIAGIEQTGEPESLSGVGGSTPEDLSLSTPHESNSHDWIREMHEQVNSLDEAYVKQYHDFESIINKLEEKRDILISTPLIFPAYGRVTSRFGYRISPFTNRREMHKGFDIATAKGSSIIATADGIVTFTGWKGSFGKTIVMDHGHGISTRYSHCDKILKKAGDIVKRGETIARVGNSGKSTGPHLHYEVRLHGVQVNPEKYLLDFYAERDIPWEDA